MIVTVFGASGLTNAHKSSTVDRILSDLGALRCDDMSIPFRSVRRAVERGGEATVLDRDLTLAT